MIEQQVEKLRQLLSSYDVSPQEKKEIIDDYKQMIEDGKQKGLSDSAILEMIGTPEELMSELRLDFKRKKRIPKGEKLIALTPFISLIAFLILGFNFNLWHPGWLVFLLIPITAIIVEMINDHDKHLTTALSPFVAGIIFFIAGFQYNLWHPAWLIFLIIPVFGIINSRDEMDRLTLFTALSPFISLTGFILIVYTTGNAHYAWLLFLLVVIFGSFHKDDKKKRWLFLTSLFVSIILYILIGNIFGNWPLAGLSFILAIVTGLFTGFIQISTDFNIEGTSRSEIVTNIFIILLSIGLFIAAGLLFDLWAVSWLFLLIIPMAMIVRYNDDPMKLTPLSPFVAVTIFMLLGFLYDLWHISWVAFLLIPIVAILEGHDEDDD